MDLLNIVMKTNIHTPCKLYPLITCSPDKVVYAWILGHQGIANNDVADSATKDVSHFFPYPVSTQYSNCKQKFNQKFI